MNLLRRLAVNRGILGGSPFFTAIAIAMGFARLLQRISGTGERKLYTHKLQDGETIVISHPQSNK